MTVVPAVLSATSMVLKTPETVVPAVLLATSMVPKTLDDSSTSSLVSIWCGAEDTA